ncbi:RNA polymerase sigma factor [Synoicihabitans lomoniglobus]|uniref:RNA polymerase sigma factor n=1 Tax=Synoicihabitans lomoniglobus TaxID=2909285 RepID=A0AAE9ZUM0_9BACT|nr:RNA polymerase sigma factor [Opitutaceae bacterium LMO-M01]WED63611.1 RNA polymerase sigma factor [Opitutaceae bacterium LMO-M01]
MEETDPDLADLPDLRAGDPEALRRVMDRWAKRLHAFAWRYLQHTTDAQEIAMEAFVRLHRSSAKLRADTRLGAWLFTTTANLCRNRLRWRRRHPGDSWEEMTETGEPGGTQPLGTVNPDPAAAAEKSDRADALVGAIEGLPHRLKTVVLLHHFDGLSYQEIGDVVGCSPRGIETRLYRARQQLREKLTKRLTD